MFAKIALLRRFLNKIPPCETRDCLKFYFTSIFLDGFDWKILEMKLKKSNLSGFKGLQEWDLLNCLLFFVNYE